jgi:hypothetical protein
MPGYSRLRVLFIGLSIALLIVAIGWLSATRTKIDLIQTKVEQTMVSSMANLVPHWPRIAVYSDPAAQAYNAPIVSQAQTFQLYQDVLEHLNQDASVPPLKVSQVSVRIEYGTAEDTLISQARIEFPLVLGIEQNLTIQSSIKTPHYTTLN